MSCFIIDQKEYAKAAELFDLLSKEKHMEISSDYIIKNMISLMEINYEAYNYRYDEDKRCPNWQPLPYLDKALIKEKFNTDYKKGKPLLCAKLFSFLRCVRYQCSEGDYGEKAAVHLSVFFSLLLNYLMQHTDDWEEIML